MRFMQEMMELSSQQQKEQLPPRAIQIVSHPFFGRVVLTAGPAQFGTDLSKSSTGVSGFIALPSCQVSGGHLTVQSVFFKKSHSLFPCIFKKARPLVEHFPNSNRRKRRTLEPFSHMNSEQCLVNHVRTLSRVTL